MGIEERNGSVRYQNKPEMLIFHGEHSDFESNIDKDPAMARA